MTVDNLIVVMKREVELKEELLEILEKKNEVAKILNENNIIPNEKKKLEVVSYFVRCLALNAMIENYK